MGITAAAEHGGTTSAHVTAEDDAVMAANGIERIPVDYFHWNGYRYSTLKDALAAAGRARIAGGALA